jgi:hypothetical protein
MKTPSRELARGPLYANAADKHAGKCTLLVAQGPSGPIFWRFGVPDASRFARRFIENAHPLRRRLHSTTAAQHNLLFVGGQQLIRANGTARESHSANILLALYNMVGSVCAAQNTSRLARSCTVRTFFPPWGAIPSRRGWRARWKKLPARRREQVLYGSVGRGTFDIALYVRQNRITRRARASGRKSKKRRAKAAKDFWAGTN